MPCNGISVIILTYKGKAQLEHCLASVVASLRNANDEVIVTEDGEDTETCEIIRSVSERFKTPLKHLTQADTDRRASTARNRGFLAATNDTILFIDHDILLPRNFLKQLGTYHQPHWVTAGRRFFLDAKCTEKIFKGEYPLRAAFSLKTKIKAILSRWEGWRYLLPLRDRLPGGTPQSWKAAATFCVAVSRKDLEKVDGFDSRYDGVFATEDWDLFARLEHAGVKFGYLPRKATVAHLHHPKAKHDLESRNYTFLEQVIAERRIQAVSGITKLL
jgi:glycosyltransferase involved in cell wall biosynthesis